MTWPTSDVVRTNADAGTDSPATFRADVLDLIDKFNLMRNHVNVFVRGLLSAADAAAARTTLVAAASGSNTDITSLGAVTGVTAAERDNSTKLATTAYVDRAGVPVGTIIAYAGPTIPTGYLVLPTAATNISRTTYAALFAAIGTYFGAGDGSTTFGMPYVIDDGTIVHSPGAYGTVTTGALLAHVHTISVTTEMAAGGNDGAARNSGTGLHTNNTSSVGGSGNLPAGARARFAIKY